MNPLYGCLSTALSVVAFTFESPAQCPLFESELTPAGSQIGDGFGFSVALGEQRALVGRYGSGAAVPETAFVFVRSGTTWVEEAELSDVPNVGAIVALSGDVAVLSDGYDDVVLYRYDGAQWRFEQVLAPTSGLFLIAFGHSLAADGDTVVIGATIDENLSGENLGVAYVFERSGGVWDEVAILRPVEPWPYDGYGAAVDVLDDCIAVGATGSFVYDEEEGEVFLYRRHPSGWRVEGRVWSGGGSSCVDFFGAGVSLDGDRLAVGAPRYSYDGAAFVFVRSGADWVLEARLDPSDGAAGKRFGESIALDGERLVAGAPWDSQGAHRAGAAYVWERHGTEWGEVDKLLGPDPEPERILGMSVSVHEGRIAAGAFGNWSSTTLAGSAYVYRVLAAPSTYCTAKQNSCGALPAIAFDGTPSAVASSGFLVNAEGVRAGEAGLVLYTDAGPAALPFQGGTLCVEPTGVRRSVPASDTGGTPGACDGSWSIDFNAFAAGDLGGAPEPYLRIPGTRVQTQWWGRDTPANGSLLTEGLAFELCP